jgi:hypothetical protein
MRFVRVLFVAFFFFGCSGTDFSGANSPPKKAKHSSLPKVSTGDASAAESSPAAEETLTSAGAPVATATPEAVSTPVATATPEAVSTPAATATPQPTAAAKATPLPMVCKQFVGRATGRGGDGGKNSPSEDCQNNPNPGAEWGGSIQSITNRYCMSPHRTDPTNYARNEQIGPSGQHGDCNNRGGQGKCGCWSCQADGIECYQP